MGGDPHPPREGLACGLCVNKMADAKLEIENPIETAVSMGASIVEHEKASISRRNFSLLVDPDCESVITLLTIIAQKQQLARLANQIVTFTV